ncbi:MAG TPA: NADP oxidoreductase [Elusimicrobiota bacterium]|nr:NADP oxidoreductase [Elusimicrobiota bacterium]
MNKIKVATVWLDGCSGCHMSFLDMDERILDLAGKIELVYSPLVDYKEFPENVDVTLVEGAVSSDDDRHKIQHIRKRTKILVALGDCAVTSNVPAMRNPFGPEPVLKRAYIENAQHKPHIPTAEIPRLQPHARPLHEVVKVDAYVPGCPPSADLIFKAVSALVSGQGPDLGQTARFG